MTFFRREAGRLDSYLDDQVAGRSIDPDDLDSALIDTWTWATTAMAHMPSDSNAKSETWRTIMQSHAIAAAPPVAVIPEPSKPRCDEVAQSRWSHRAMALVGTMAVAASLAVGIVGYDRFGGSNEPTSIPAASWLAPGTPEASGCDVPRREPGEVDAIMAGRPSQAPYFPRLGHDPVRDPINSMLGREVVDGTFLYGNSSQDDSVTASIQETLDTLYACRFYALNAGQVDLDGPYFALYSDDYLRREAFPSDEVKNGPVIGSYTLSGFWQPNQPPVVLETRKLVDGDRYLVVLEEDFFPDAKRVLSVVPDPDGGWLVDEVGRMSAVIGNGTPAVPTDTPTPYVAVGTPIPPVDRYPHELGIAISDIALAVADQEDVPICNGSMGTPEAWCGQRLGIYLQGPWGVNELPADTAFTLTFANTSTVETQITSDDLSLVGSTAPGIDLTLPPGEQVDLIVHQAEGPATVTFTQGDSETYWIIQFEPIDGRFSMG